MKTFDGKVAIVTGGGNGIGLCYAQKLAAEGARVVIAEINAETGAAAARGICENGGRAISLRTDISNEADTQAVAAAAIAEFGGIDILVNNAAIFANISVKPIEEIPVAEWDRVMTVNLRGLFLMIRAVLPNMKARGYGKIVNISSNTIFSGGPMMSHYVTSKAGVIGLTRSVAKEVGSMGIRVNAVTPGLTDTVAAEQTIPKDRFDAVLQLRPIKRHQTPDDLAGTVLFLCSPASDFITGQIINVDGGQILH
jgi:NAD(P)-dependent dehydrogenase (short-subunit alcohol dehydrogenase family)